MRTVAAIIALSLASTALLAQDDAKIQAARAEVQAERTKLVAANLPLTEEESAKFWPLYNEYRAEAGKLSDRAVSLIKDYAANYENMTDDKARDLLKQQLQLEEDRMKLRKSYAGKFEKVMPAKKVARYYQIENKLDIAVQYEAATSIPLVQ
jgi:hypothetical protein